MGQGRSRACMRPHTALELVSITWADFAQFLYELNDRCAQFADSDGRYLLFAIRKGSADTLFWKATVRICALKVSFFSERVRQKLCFSSAPSKELGIRSGRRIHRLHRYREHDDETAPVQNVKLFSPSCL
ncbi:unnamed protein product [Gongylonema pulchrum]|uniref:SH2 domain-containing protein n=1 Tax=Gongylonema pulchrum TaxID=637853 RepID=A0A183EMS7_9BILA|nr:unnamed protein product [Gongylonema pulchrum]